MRTFIYLIILFLSSSILSAQEFNAGIGLEIRDDLPFSSGLTVRGGFNMKHVYSAIVVQYHPWQGRNYDCWQLGNSSRIYIRSMEKILNVYAEGFFSTQVGGNVKGAKLGTDTTPYDAGYSSGNFNRVEINTAAFLGFSVRIKQFGFNLGYGYMYYRWSYKPVLGTGKILRRDGYEWCANVGLNYFIPHKNE